VSFRPLTRGVRRVLIVWSVLCAFVWICIPIGQVFEGWRCDAEGAGAGAAGPGVVTCEEIREDSVFEDTAFATVYIGVAWLLVAGVIFGTWMLIARARR